MSRTRAASNRTACRALGVEDALRTLPPRLTEGGAAVDLKRGLGPRQGHGAVLTRRKPRLAPQGQLLPRDPTRQPSALLLQTPPRPTRYDPDVGPRGSLPGEDE